MWAFFGRKKRSHLPFDNMHIMFRDGVIGTKEFRNWLEQVDEAFAEIRDTEVDNQIDQLARERARALQPPEEEVASDR